MTMTLRDIQNSWNALVPIAIARGVEAQTWAVPPQTLDRGLRRLNWLRQQLGIAVPADQIEFEHSPGAALPPIREIMDQYNALIPEAQRRGITNARLWTGLPSTSLRGMQRLQWLRRQLGETVSPVTIVTVVEGIKAFDALTFGLEFECKMPFGLTKDDIAAAFNAAGVPCRVAVYGHATDPQYWRIVTDGSLLDYAHGIEVVSPPLNGEEGFRAMRKACTILTEKRCKVTAKCGLHVHVGWKGHGPAGFASHPWDAPTLRNLMKLQSRYETVIDSLLAPSRRDNQYCRSNRHATRIDKLYTASTWQEVCLAIGQDPRTDHHIPRGGDRYKKLNLKPLGVYGTVEFRQHQGTVDVEKTENWVRLCLRMVLTAKHGQIVEAPQTLAGLGVTIGLTAEEAEHFQDRLAGFARREASAARRQEQRRLSIMQRRWQGERV